MSSNDNRLDPILRTKLYRPQLGSDLVERTRLTAMMTSTDQVSLLVVSAPAGYGKSIMVSQWAGQQDHAVAWLSLSANEGEPQTFINYLIEAIDSVSSGACPSTRALAGRSPLPPIPVIAAHLTNDLDALSDPLSIVLDDYHLISASSSVHELMGNLLLHALPHVQFVLVTRRDPPLELARLRASAQLIEIRSQDLRFTTNETRDFLAATASVDLSSKALDNLEANVEGWVVGLRLVSLALQKSPDPDRVLNRMRGGMPYIREYLLQEVLSSLSPDVREFLLISSAVDRFCLDLLVAIGEPGDGHEEPSSRAREFMLELQRSNLFTISLDSEGEWFRYHHLFKQLIEQELQRVHGTQYGSELHARAGDWFTSRGLIDEALGCYLESGDPERAADLVASKRVEIQDADKWYVLQKWLSRLPKELVAQRAELLVSRAWILMHHYQYVEMLALVEQIEPMLLDGELGQVLTGEVSLLRGFGLYLQGEGARSLEALEDAVQRIPTDHLDAWCEARTLHALASQMEGHYERVVLHLTQLCGQQHGSLDIRVARLLATLAFVELIAGNLEKAGPHVQRMKQFTRDGNHEHVGAWIRYLEGLIHLYRGEPEEAIEPLKSAVQNRFILQRRAALDSFAGLAMAQQMLGRVSEARTTLQQLKEFTAGLDDSAALEIAGSSETKLALLQGRAEASGSWFDGSLRPRVNVLLFWCELPCLVWCWALTERGSRDSLREAEEVLIECLAVSRAHHNTCQRISILALLAVACEKLEKFEEAQIALGEALTLAEPAGFVLPFLQLGSPMAKMLGARSSQKEHGTLVVRILSIAAGLAKSHEYELNAEGLSPPGSTAAPRSPGTALDKLTNRELDVLELLVQRLQDKEIADRLSISVHTVKDHLKHVYDKLEVHDRRHAARVAKELGLLGPRN